MDSGADDGAGQRAGRLGAGCGGLAQQEDGRLDALADDGREGKDGQTEDAALTMSAASTPSRNPVSRPVVRNPRSNVVSRACGALRQMRWSSNVRLALLISFVNPNHRRKRRD